MGDSIAQLFGTLIGLAFLFGLPAAALLFGYLFYQSAKRQPPPPHVFQSTRDDAPDPFPSGPFVQSAPLPPPTGPRRPDGGFGSPPPHVFGPPPPSAGGDRPHQQPPPWQSKDTDS